MSISIERHLAIAHPTTISPNKILFWIPIIFSLVYNIPKFFEIAACDDVEGTEELIGYDISQDIHLSKTNSTAFSISNDYLTEGNGKLDLINSSYRESNSNKTNTTKYFVCDPDGMRATALRQNEWYIIFYVVCSKLLLVELLPWLTVIALNIWSWRKIVVFQRTRQATLKKGDKRGKVIKHCCYYDLLFVQSL